MKNKKTLIPSIVFSLLAILSSLIFFLSNSSVSSVLDVFALSLLFPGVSAFIVAYFLGYKIFYNAEAKYGNIFQSLGFSILIVILSVILWTVLALSWSILIIGTPWGEAKFVILVAILALTMGGLLTYPSGLIAGFIIWSVSKKQNKSCT